MSVYFEASGITVIDFYSNMIFEKVVGNDLKLCTLMTLIVNFISLVFSMVVAVTIEKLGRKFLLITG